MEIRDNLSAIVAVCDDWGIGRAGDMIVANRADMRHFVRCTTGHTVIMGRKTLESFPGGRPLKDRRNIVLTRDASYARGDVEVAHTVSGALALLRAGEDAWVIGGGEVYRQLLPACARAVVTRNHCTRPADTFFPNLDEDEAWRVAEADDGHVIAAGEGDEGVAFEFVTYERVRRPRSAHASGSVLDTAIDLGAGAVEGILDVIS